MSFLYTHPHRKKNTQDNRSWDIVIYLLSVCLFFKRILPSRNCNQRTSQTLISIDIQFICLHSREKLKLFEEWKNCTFASLGLLATIRSHSRRAYPPSELKILRINYSPSAKIKTLINFVSLFQAEKKIINSAEPCLIKTW